MATHAHILAWKVSWGEEPCRLQSIRSQESNMTEPPCMHARKNDHCSSLLHLLYSGLAILIHQLSPSVTPLSMSHLPGCLPVPINPEYQDLKALVAQLCPMLCDPIDCSPPGSSVHDIPKARILEWVAISSSRGIFPTQGLNPGLSHCRQVLYCLIHQGSPQTLLPHLARKSKSIF